MKKKEKFLVAMSGGVDSSVAAALLVEQGYDVTGMFAVNYDNKEQVESCWRGDYQDALRVAAKLGIPLLRWDFTKEYKKMVLDYMYKEYSLGRTPNPDILCNKFVKFGAWLDKAKKMGFDKIATGHYASLREEIQNPKSKILNKSKIKNSKDKLQVMSYKLQMAKDDNKDQTYFLHQLNQKQLQHVMFPIGDLLKSEVRSLARRFKLPTAEKEESMGICFVGEVNMKDFLKNKIKTKIGDVVLSSGEKVGEHEGLAYYTIGQRHMGLKTYDLRLMTDKPLFVVDKDIKKNQLVVGYEKDPLLYKKEISIIDVNWIGGHSLKFPLKCEVRLRHRQPLQVCHCEEALGRRGNLIVVEFEEPQRAITPGQFVVFYSARRSPKKAKAGQEVECLGGGVIK